MNPDNIIKEASKIKLSEVKEENQNQIKVTYFSLVHLLIKERSENFFITSMFIIFQFFQLISFPFSPSFNHLWTTNRFSSFSSFMYYFQIISLLEGKENVYITIFVLCCLFVVFLYIFIIRVAIKVVRLQLSSKAPLHLLNTLLSMNKIFFLPIVKIFVSIFNCKNKDEHFYSETLKCYSTAHIIFSISGGVCLLLFFALMMILEVTNYEYRHIPNAVTAKMTSSTTIELLFTKLILVVIFEMIPEKWEINITFSTLISIFIFYHFIHFHPFYNKIVNRIYFTMYFLLFWTNFVVFISILFKSVFKEKNVPLLLIGYLIIFLNSFFGVTEFGINDFLVKDALINNPLTMLKKIKFFVALVDCLNDYSYRRENVYLFGYIKLLENIILTEEKAMQVLLKEYEYTQLSSTEQKNCQLVLYHYAQNMYKNAIKKFPSSILIRISYSNFLFEKLHLKHKCLDEIANIEKFSLNFEESFLIFHYKKMITEQMDESDIENGMDLVSALAFKRHVNTFKTSIVKVSQCYVEFWSLLYETNDENRTENFEKMSDLGNEIENLIEIIHLNFKKIEDSNINDPETMKLYSEFLSDILHEDEQAKIFDKKIIEIEAQQHKFDENNIYHLNYKVLSQNEEYRYVVASSQESGFGNIVNLSLSVCSLFGYKKEDLIGRSINIIIPDIMIDQHNKLLEDKIKKVSKDPEFQKKRRTKLNENKVYGKNKAKYLIPCVLKNGVILSEEGEVYFIAQFINELNQAQLNEESCHVLTDNNLHIQNFTCNSLKFLGLDSSSISNDIELVNYIQEFNEEFLEYEINLNEARERDLSKTNNNNYQKPDINKVKIQLLKKSYMGPKEINWESPDFPKGMIPTRLKSSKLQAFDHATLAQLQQYSSSTKIAGKFPSSPRNRLLTPGLGKSRLSIAQIDEQKRESKLFLEVQPIKLGMVRVGFLFKFTPSSIYLRKHRTQVFETIIHEIESPHHIGEKHEPPKASLIFGSIFQQIAGKKKDPFSRLRKKKDKNYIPEIEKESKVFNFDLSKISFKMGPLNEHQILRQKLKEMAIKKVEPESENESSEESSEEESSEEETIEEEGDDTSYSSKIDSESRLKFTQRQRTLQPYQVHHFQGKRVNNEGYYKVNTEKITFFQYNYKTGIVDREEIHEFSQIDIIFNGKVPQRGQKQKEEQEKTKTDEENEELLKGEKTSKKELTIKPITVTEKDVIINQMKIQLNNKDLQPSVLCLAFVTLVLFVCFFVTGVILLEIVIGAKTKTTQNFNLIFHTFELNQNLLFSIHTVREITALKIEKYTNYYVKDRDKYIKDLEDQIITYFNKNQELLEEFSMILGSMKGEEKEKLESRRLNLKFKSDDDEVRYYNLSLLSALFENNLSLYNFWTLPFEDQTLKEKNGHYFLYNSCNEIMVGSNEETNLLFERYVETINSIIKTFLLYIGVNVAFFVLSYFLFTYWYEKAELIKQIYLSVFYEIGDNLISTCLAKCEVFNHKVQVEVNNNTESEFLSEGLEEEEIKQVLKLRHKNKLQALRRKQGKAEMTHAIYKYKFLIFIVFAIICLYTSLTGFGKILVLINFKRISHFVHFRGSEQLNYLLVFNLVREEIFQQNTLIMGKPAKNYTTEIMKEIFITLQKEIIGETEHLKYMPQKYQQLYNAVIDKDVCSYMEEYLQENNKVCKDFFFGTFQYGLRIIYTTFVENLRFLHDKYLKSEVILNKNGIDLSELTLKRLDQIYGNSDKKDIWNNYGPLAVLNSSLYGELLVVFDHFFKTVFLDTTENMKNFVFEYQTEKHDLIVLILYAYFGVTGAIFIFLVIPFEFNLNQTIFKAKNMLSIIPLEILATLNQVKKMLKIGNDKQSNYTKAATNENEDVKR